MDIRRQQYEALREKAASGKILTATELNALARLEADLEDMAAGDLVFQSAEEVAEYSGYSKRTVWDAVKKGLLIRQDDKTYLQEDVDAWLAARGRKPVAGKNRNNGKTGEKETKTKNPEQACLWDRADEEARYRHYRATREKLIVERMQGELIPRDEVQRQFVARAHEYKTSMLLLSRRIAHTIAARTGMDSRDVAAIIDDEVRQLLTAISRPVELEVDIR